MEEHRGRRSKLAFAAGCPGTRPGRLLSSHSSVSVFRFLLLLVVWLEVACEDSAGTAPSPRGRVYRQDFGGVYLSVFIGFGYCSLSRVP